MRESVKSLFCAILLLTVLYNPSFSQSDPIKQGWSSFIDNNISEAKRQFRAATEDEARKAEAHLILSIIYSTEHNTKKSFDEFINFFNATDYPDPYVVALWHTGSLNSAADDKGDELIDFLEDISENPRMDGTIRAFAYDILGRLYDGKGEFEYANESYEQIGAVMNWQLVGGFDNISACGFDKDYEPIAHPEADYDFRNKENAVVNWFSYHNRRAGQWIDLANHFYYNNSIIFAQTYCNSPAEQVVQLRVGTSGSLKAWINDHLVLSIDEERNNNLDTYISTIRLNKGFNRILLQIGESEVDNSNFLVRLTDEKGNNIEDLEFAAGYRNYDKNYSFEGKVIPSFAEAFFQEKVKNEPDNILNYILLTQAYILNDKTFEARRILDKAFEMAPRCSYLLWLYARIYQQDENRTSLSHTLEKMKMIDPDNTLSLDLLFEEAYDREDYVEAKSILSEIRGYFGEDENVLEKQLKLASVEKRIEDMLQVLDNAYYKYPDNYSFVYMKYLVEKEVKKNSEEAAEVLENYIDNNYNPEAIDLLANYYFSKMKIKDGIELIETKLVVDPSAPGYHGNLGWIYFHMQQYDKALEYFKECTRIAPFIGSYYEDIGQTYSEMKNQSEALKAYLKCIEYYPNNYEVRRKIRELMGHKEIFDNFDEPDYYSSFKNSPGGDKYPEDNSLILLDEDQVVVYEKGGSEERHYLLVKVFNASGIDDWKEYYIPYYNGQKLIIEKAEVLKKDGNRSKAETSRGHVVFTGLEGGDGILLVYRFENYRSGKLGRHFWDWHMFSNYFPSLSSSYKLLIAENIKFDYKVVNSKLKPSKEKLGAYYLYKWEQDEMPSIKYESYMPRLVDAGEVLHISTFPDWDYISKWYSDLSRTKAKTGYEVEEVIEELFSDKKDLSEMEKVKIIYEYIVKNIRYSSVSFRQSGLIPQKATKVLNTRIGDCKDVSTLFVAMCKELSIDASIVLIDLRSNGSNDLVLPSINFDHAIAKVNIEGLDYYVELTSDTNPFSTVYQRLHKAASLDIDNSKDVKSDIKFLDPPTRVRNTISRKTEVTFSGNDMLVSKDSYKYGAYASGMRETYRDIGQKEQEKNMQEAISSAYPSVKLQSLEFGKNLKTIADSVNYKYKYQVDEAFTVVGGMSLLKLPWADNIEPMSFLNYDNRNYPVDFWRVYSFDSKNETMTITIPEKMKLAEIPQNLHYSCDVADYDISFELKGNKLTAKRKFSIKSDLVSVESYNKFRTFFINVIKSDLKPIAFK